MIRRDPADGETPGINPGVIEVLDLYALGMIYPEIGERLFISPETAKSRVAKACQAARVRHSAGLLNHAWRHGYMGQVIVDLTPMIPVITDAVERPELYALRGRDDGNAKWTAKAAVVAIHLKAAADLCATVREASKGAAD
jgi:DNA-binding CsgD family transcriptional regulator